MGSLIDGAARQIGQVAVLSLASLLLACDQDPFGLSCRRIAGNYCLRQWEDGETYYIETLSGREVANGTVKAIDWNAQHILVLRQPHALSDGQGYILIDVRSGSEQGPVQAVSSFRNRDVSAMNAIDPKAAWDKLGG